jgi:cell wall assembly regulator SMI1
MNAERAEIVRRSWNEIVGWCAAHAPATAAVLQAPADEAAVADAQAATEVVWPEELVAWLRMSDGADRSLEGDVIPLGVRSPGGRAHRRGLEDAHRDLG